MKKPEGKVTIKAVEHHKHADLKRPALGDFGRNELGIIGAPCALLREHAQRWITGIGERCKIAWVDQAHCEEPGKPVNPYQNRPLFHSYDLVLINSNHFTAKQQIVIIHPDKPLDRKLDRLKDVQLMLLAEGMTVPEYLSHLAAPVFHLDEDGKIVDFILSYLQKHIPVLKGLVLAGGKSTRMQTDKGNIVYHGKNQRQHTYDLLGNFCEEVFISGNKDDGLPCIPDTFTGLGPFGGILSAMQTDPDAAWLTLACDLPYLTEKSISFLVNHRNPSKVATAFMDSDGKFPEPLITIWEPRAYPAMLQFLSQGYSCPRKVLINSDIELLQAPDVSEFKNVNYPEERDEAMRKFSQF